MTDGPRPIIDGELRLDAELGGGVWRAYDLALQRAVAVKLEAPGNAPIARIEHPNVVAVYRVGEHKGRRYTAMELIDGGDARAWQQDEARTWREMLALWTAAGDGIAAAHAADKRVRVEAARVLIGKDRRPRVTAYDDDDDDDEDDEHEHEHEHGYRHEHEHEHEHEHGHEHGHRREDECEAYVAAVREALRGRGAPRWIDRALAKRWTDVASVVAALRDPRPARRRRWIAIGGGAAAAAAAVTLVAWQARGRAAPAPRCDGGAAEIAEAWSPSAAAALRRGFEATGLPYAAALADRTIADLDGYASRWAAARDQTCRAPATDRRTAALAERSLTCLARRKAALAALVPALDRLDAAHLDGGVRAIDGLGSIAACRDPAALDGEPLRPDDPDRARAYDAAIVELDRERSFLGIDDAAGNVDALDRALADARRSGVEVLIVDAMERRAFAALRHDEPDAVARIEDAYFAARAAGERVVATDAALLRIYGALDGGDLDGAATWLEHAETEVAAGQLGVPVQARVAQARAIVLSRRGKLDDAVAAAEDALRLSARTEESSRIDRVDLLELEANALADAGQLARAETLGALAVREAEAANGPDHPSLAQLLTNLGITQSDAGHHADAIASQERAVAVCRPSPECARGLPTLLLNLGLAEVDGGRDTDALPILDEAERGLVALHRDADAALAVNNRGLAYIHLERYADAEAALRDALARVEATSGGDHPDAARVLGNLAVAIDHQGRWAEGAGFAERAIATWERAAPGISSAGLPMVERGRAQLALGRPRDAVATLRGAVTRLDAGGFDIDTRAEARLALSKALWAIGARAEARQLAAEAHDLPGIDAEMISETAEWQRSIRE